MELSDSPEPSKVQGYRYLHNLRKCLRVKREKLKVKKATLVTELATLFRHQQ